MANSTRPQGRRPHDVPLRRPAAAPRRFAYLLHRSDATLDNPALDTVPERRACEAPADAPLVVLSDVAVVAPGGAATRGDVILTGRTDAVAGSLPEIVRLQRALRLAEQRGAGVVALSPRAAALSRGGRDLLPAAQALRAGTALQGAAIEGCLLRALARLGRRPAQVTAAVVGATGESGCTSAALLAQRVEQLVLIGDGSAGEVVGRQALIATGASLCRHVAEQGGSGPLAQRILELVEETLPLSPEDYRRLTERLVAEGMVAVTADRRRLLLADVVVIAGNGVAVDPRYLPAAVLVCDARRPRALSRAQAAERPDLMVLDPLSFELHGGEGPSGLFGTRGLPPALVEALVCALDAEAAALPEAALRQAPWRFSASLLARAGGLGFRPTPLCSFQSRVLASRWETMAKLRVLPRRIGWSALPPPAR